MVVEGVTLKLRGDRNRAEVVHKAGWKGSDSTRLPPRFLVLLQATHNRVGEGSDREDKGSSFIFGPNEGLAFVRTGITVWNLPPIKCILMMVLGLLVRIVKMLIGGNVVVEGSVGVCEVGRRSDGERSESRKYIVNGRHVKRGAGGEVNVVAYKSSLRSSALPIVLT